jgi:hypothetical protein
LQKKKLQCNSLQPKILWMMMTLRQQKINTIAYTSKNRGQKISWKLKYWSQFTILQRVNIFKDPLLNIPSLHIETLTRKSKLVNVKFNMKQQNQYHEHRLRILLKQQLETSSLHSYHCSCTVSRQKTVNTLDRCEFI